MIINKITVGFVVQSYDTEKGEFISQDFICDEDVNYEDEKGNTISDPVEKGMENKDGSEPYLSFDMVQPVLPLICSQCGETFNGESGVTICKSCK